MCKHITMYLLSVLVKDVFLWFKITTGNRFVDVYNLRI